MTEEALMLFLKRILECGSNEKSTAALYQLKAILEKQNASIHTIHLINQTIESIPEAKNAAKKALFSRTELRNALMESEVRRQKEEEQRKRTQDELRRRENENGRC